MAESRRARDTYADNRCWYPRNLDDLKEERQPLLDRAIAGSSEAHGALLGSFLPMMCCYFRRGLPRELDREVNEFDLMQGASLLAWRAFDKFHGCRLSQYRDWLMTICRRLPLTVLRRFGAGGPHDLAREQPLDDEAVGDGGQHPYGRRQPSPQEILTALEASAELEAALLELPADERNVVRWHHFDRITFGEIAGRLYRSRHWVERAFKRALGALKRRLGSAHPAAPGPHLAS